MFPAQTSLMPAQIALVRFWETGGNLLGNYPYWYEGTTPYNYLTGPILPSILVFLHRLLPNFSLFELLLGLVGVFWVIGGVGVYLLIRGIKGNQGESGGIRGEGVLAAVFYLFGPIVPFLFRFSDGLYLIAFSLLPFVLVKYLKLLKSPKSLKEEPKPALLLCLLIAFVILIDSLIIPTLVFGMAMVFLAQVGWKKTEEKLKQTFLIFTLSFLISTFWYTPGYWLTLLGAPSLGGIGVLGVLGLLGKLLPSVLAITTAIVTAKFFKKRDILRDFVFYWLVIFGFLTLIRFLSDPDFWLDWISYGMELQLGLAVLLGIVTNNWFYRLKNQKSNIQDQRYKSKIKYFSSLAAIFAIYFLLFAVVSSRYVLGTLQKDITQTVEYRIGKQLDERVKEPLQGKQESRRARVFLSGTTAFWLNAFFDIPQVRGGVDQVAVGAEWREAAWEVREMGKTEKLRGLGVSYLVVHTKDSQEFYHDFNHPEKFTTAPRLTKIYDEKGDQIYRLK